MKAPPILETKRDAERAAEIRRIIAILHKWGIRTLGQFAALEKEDVSLRLGPEAVRLWERASGKATRLLKLIQPPESFVESFEFENEIETSEPLLFMLRRFLDQLTCRLGALYLVAGELHLQITFSDRNSYQHRFKIPQPSNNVEALFRMLQTHLENFRSESPIVAVALEAISTRPGRQQFGLFETALRNPAQLSETLARLVGLVGAARVGRPVLEDTHRADAFHMEPFTWELPESNGDAVASAVPADKESVPVALRRFRPARTLSSGDEIAEREGPYLASGNWWDENVWARAEWDVQLANGTLCRCHEEPAGWGIDGVYD